VSAGGGWTKTGSIVELADSADNAVVQSTLTVQGNAFSVGGSTLVVTNGNIGVGTTSPSAKLDIYGQLMVGGNAADKDFLTVMASARAFPSSDGLTTLWSANGAYWAAPMIYRSKRFPDAGGGIFPDNEYGELMLQGTSHGSYNRGISFVTSPNDATSPSIKMRIDSGGSVGIGTTSPGAKLEVKQDADSNYALQVSSNDGTGMMVVDKGGKVGIGTTIPTAALHVVGISSFTTSITVNGVEYAYVPRGQVSFFNLSACPAGWAEFTQARGRYPVGLPSGGALAATVGTALSDQENRPAGSHVHSVTDPGHTHAIQLFNGSSGSSNQIPGQNSGSYGSQWGTESNTTGITIAAPSGSVAGTNSPYIQLLVCQKD